MNASILRKARALRRLASNAGSPEEAQAAARVLAELIDRHRISQAELEEQGAATESFERAVLFEAGRARAWRIDLAAVLCRHFSVYLVGRRQTVRRPTTIYEMCGTDDDIASVRYMHAWLASECQRLSTRQRRGLRTRDSWRLGFVHGVAKQLAASRSERATSSALVHLGSRLARAKDHFHAALGREPTMRQRRPTVDAEAYLNGMVEGLGHQMTKPIGQGSASS
jgi:hypothetical protein